MKFNLNGYQHKEAPKGDGEFTNYVFRDNTCVRFDITKVRENDWGISLQLKAQAVVNGEKKTGFFFANVNPGSIQRVGALCESIGINPEGDVDSDDFIGKVGYGITKTYTKNSGEKANDMKFFITADDRRAIALKEAMGGTRELDIFEEPTINEAPLTFDDGLNDPDFYELNF